MASKQVEAAFPKFFEGEEWPEFNPFQDSIAADDAVRETWEKAREQEEDSDWNAEFLQGFETYEDENGNILV